MAKRKKKMPGIIKDMAIPLTFAGGAMGASILGGAFQSKLPAGTTNPLTSTGSTMGRFVGPISAIAASGIVFKQLKSTKKKIKGGVK